MHKLADALRDVPSRTWLTQLANEMGFNHLDVANFAHVRNVYTVVSGGSSRSPGVDATAVLPAVGAVPALAAASKPRASPLQFSHDTPWLKPALLSSVVTDQRTGRMQMLSQGNLPFLLANCSEYFDGSTIWPLTQNRRAALLSTYQQWRAEDLNCTAIAYDPVSHQEAALFQLLDAAVKRVARHGSVSVPDEAPDPRGLSSEDVGLGFDDSRVYLLAREGDVRLNAQVDARVNAKHNDHLFAQYQALLMGSTAKETTQAAHAATSAAPGPSNSDTSLASLVEARLMRMLSGQIFVGLVASRLQPRRKMQETIKDLDDAGIRFCFMSNRR